MRFWAGGHQFAGPGADAKLIVALRLVEWTHGNNRVERPCACFLQSTMLLHVSKSSEDAGTISLCSTS